MNDKEIYKQKLRAQLDEWRAEIDEMRAKAAQASADARLDMNKRADTIEEKWEAAKKKLHELTEASDDKWDDVKAQAEAAWETLKETISNPSLRQR